MPDVIKVDIESFGKQSDVVKVDVPSFEKDIKKVGIPTETPTTIKADVESFNPIQNIVQHPFKAVLEPAAKTVTGKSFQERAQEATAPAFRKVPSVTEYWDAVAKNTIAGIGGQVADIATTPASYIPLPIGKIIGKIPFKGTTLEKIATTVPVGQILNKDVGEIVKYQEALRNLPSKVLESSKPLADIAEAVDPVTKITNALKEAQPLRDAQEHLYSIERSKRAGAIEKIGQSKSGESAFYSQLGALKGELPKVSFEGIRNKVSQSDIDTLFNNIQSNSVLSPYEKITAKTGLSKLLGTTGGGVPNNSELDALGEVFPQGFIQTVLEKRPLIQKIGTELTEVFNVPRSIMATFDMSAPLRQGVFFVGRPKQFLPAFGNMFKYFWDEKAYDGLIQNIKSRPTYPLMREAKLSLSDIGVGLSHREEAFMSNLPNKIPLFGSVVKASNRAYSGFLNKLRADSFDDLVNKANMQGVEITPKVAKNIGEFVSAATGRGKLPNSLEPATVALSNLLFSPRLISSRLTMLNPQFYTKLDPFTRKEALKSLFTFSGTASSVLSLASLGGAKVVTDMNNADFGKIKVGNTRYDILGGFQQYIRLASQLITGKSVSSTTGVPIIAGEGYKAPTRLDLVGRFAESKLAPVPSFVKDILRGKTFKGENLSVTDEVAKRFVPLVIQDMNQLYKERGFEGIGMSIPSIFGVSVQTYSPTPSDLVSGSKSIKTYVKKLISQGRIDEGRAFFKENADMVRAGEKLEKFQKQINKLESIKTKTEQYVQYSPEKKKSIIFELDNKIKELENQMNLQAESLKDINAPTP